ncbi:co-chaperone GroES, partial [Escherichia coli]|nr:co-chaperone GroES [Escherichia coli]
SNQRVCRIVARFDEDTVHMITGGLNKGMVERIEPIQYFTKFSFIPDFEGKFYDYGFGRLLYAINEAVNTTINELLDAGALANLQSGFVS